MSNSVGIRELRQQASVVVKRASGGEVIEITEHGHPVARLVPLRPEVLDQLTIEGRATAAKGDLLDLLDELSLPAPARGKTPPSQAVAELRDES